MTKRTFTARSAFWGISLVVLAWLAMTLSFEIHAGLPVNAMGYVKRSVGWGVEFMLLRSLMLGVRRFEGGKGNH